MKKNVLSILVIAVSLIIAPVSGVSANSSNHNGQQAAAKQQAQKRDQASFNKKVAEINKQIDLVKREQKNIRESLNAFHTQNAISLLQIYGEESGLFGEDLVTYYYQQAELFAERDEMLFEYFYEEEIDVLSPAYETLLKNLDAIRKGNASVQELNKKFALQAKAKNFEAAVKTKTEVLKREQQILKLLKQTLEVEKSTYEVLYQIVLEMTGSEEDSYAPHESEEDDSVVDKVYEDGWETDSLPPVQNIWNDVYHK